MITEIEPGLPSDLRTRIIEKDALVPSMDAISSWVDFQRARRDGNQSEVRYDSSQTAWELLNNFDEYVLYEDDHLIAINKPPDVASQLDEGLVSVESIARYRHGDSVRAAHRLDRDTSGVLVLVRSLEGRIKLAEQFSDKEKAGVKKYYYAVVDGEFPHTSPVYVEADMVIGDKTARVAGKQKPPDGSVVRNTKTVFDPLALMEMPNGKIKTFLDVQLITGRRHQIRVIAAQVLGTPVTGDLDYGKELTDVPRHLLHARHYSFVHPFTSERVTIEAPLPDDFATFIGKAEAVAV